MAKDTTVKTDLSAVTQQIKESMSYVSDEIKNSSEKTIQAISLTDELSNKKLDAVNMGINSIRTNMQDANRSLNYIAVKMNDQLSIMKAEANAVFDRRDDFSKNQSSDDKNGVSEKDYKKGLFSSLGGFLKESFSVFFRRMLVGLARLFGVYEIGAILGSKLGAFLPGVFSKISSLAGPILKGIFKAIPYIGLVTGLFDGIGNALNSDEVSRMTGKDKESLNWVDRFEVGFAHFMDIITLGLFGADNMYKFTMFLSDGFGKMVDSFSDWLSKYDFSFSLSGFFTGISNVLTSMGNAISEWAANNSAIKGWQEYFGKLREENKKDLERRKKELEARKKEAIERDKRTKQFFKDIYDKISPTKLISDISIMTDNFFKRFGDFFDAISEKLQKFGALFGLWKPSTTKGYSIPGTKDIISGIDVRGGVQGAYATDPYYASKITSTVASIGGEHSMKSAKDIEQIIKARSKGLDDKQIADISSAIYKSSTENGIDPTLLLGSTLLETGNFSNIKSGNYGGVTWDPSMGEDKKGHARPSNEGGYYVKFDSIKDSFDAQAKIWAKHRVKPDNMIESDPNAGKYPTDENLIRYESKKTVTPSIPRVQNTDIPSTMQKTGDKQKVIENAVDNTKNKPVANATTPPTTFAMANNTSNNTKSDVYFIQQAPLGQYAGVSIQNVG
jgi:flagellum-specific peptidoglycan hydrolase FlgJ